MAAVLLRRVVGILVAATATVATGLPTGFGVTSARAAEPAVATVTAHGAPDGVFVEWTPQDWFNYSWRLTRTVGGVTSSIDVVGQTYADTALRPGESATYQVAQRVGTAIGGLSNSATAARDLASWTAPDGARTLVLSGYEAPQGSPNPLRQVDPPALQLRGDGKVAVGYPGDPAFSRVPGPGTYALRADPVGAEIGFDTYCPTGPASGEMVVEDVVYGASGIPLQLGADLAWSCAGGPVWREHLRYHSPTPLAQVVLEPVSPEASVVRGGSVSSEWRLHNLGDGPATVGRVQVRSGYEQVTPAVSSGCDGKVIGPEESCPVTVTFATTPQADPVGSFSTELSATLDGLPGAQVTAPVTVYRELAAPSSTIVARTSSAVALQFSVPHAAEMQPLSSLMVERQVNGAAWSKVADVPHVDEVTNWTDWAAPGGSTVAYRARVVAVAGDVSEPSEPVTVTVPLTSLVSGESHFAGYGDPTDPAWVEFPMPSGGPLATGVAASPDRAHLAFATWNGTDNVGRLFITDLDGSDPVELLRRSDGSELRRPHFSPDGRRIAYTDGRGAYETVAIIDIASRDVMHLSSQGIPYGWSPDGKSLLLGPGSAPTGAPTPGLRWVKVPTPPNGVQDWTSPTESWTSVPGTGSAVNDNFGYASSVTVSRLGDIAWLATPAASGAQTLYRVPAAGGTLGVLWAPPGCSLGEPVFAPTGTELSIGARGKECAWAGGTLALAVPASGTATVARRITTFAPRSVAWLTTGSAPPTARVIVPTLTSSSALLRFDSSTDPDDAVGALTYTCRLDSGVTQSCGPAWQLTGLRAGSHTATVVATDPSGQVSRPFSVSWTVDTTAPTVSLGSVPSTLLASSMKLSWTAKETGGSALKSYDVRVRYATPGGGFTAYVYPATWQGRTTTSLTVSLTKGNTYCFSVRARDAVGNVGSFTGERCTKVALDDRALTIRGGMRGTSRYYMYGTYSRVTGTAQSLYRSGIRARQIGLVLTTCSSCAPLDVWIGGVKLGRVSTYSATTKVRQVKWLPLAATTRSGTVVVRPASSRSAYVDGLVIQK